LPTGYPLMTRMHSRVESFDCSQFSAHRKDHKKCWILKQIELESKNVHRWI